MGGVLNTLSAWVMDSGAPLARVRAGAEVRASPRLAFTVTINMAKSIRVTAKKRRGRPATTGAGTQIGERWHGPELVAIDAWLASTGETMTRAQAVRRLVELGLTVKIRAKPVSKPGRRLRAQELATKAIEKIIDPSAPPEEREQRRRHLTKGPIEFREARVDQKGEGEVTATKLQELEEIAAELLATARKLPPGPDRRNMLAEIGRYRSQIISLQGPGSTPVRRGRKAKGK